MKFTKTKDIITIGNIIKKATADPNFCHDIFDIINKRESILTDISSKFHSSIVGSKNIIEKIF